MRVTKGDPVVVLSVIEVKWLGKHKLSVVICNLKLIVKPFNFF